jgi:ABC-type transport system involved in multi-copper enzyme maturation permease subunit
LESPFNGSYYGTSPILIYLLVTFFNLIIYIYPNDKFIISEKIIYSIIVSIISLFVSFLFIKKILSLIYGYDSDYYDELQSPPILNSILFYFLSTAFGVLIFEIWLRNKKSIY